MEITGGPWIDEAQYIDRKAVRAFRRVERKRRAGRGWFNWYVRHYGIRIDRLSEREAAKLFRQWSHRRAH